MNKFKERLVYLRNQMQLTIPRLSEQTGIPDQTIRQWESGRSRPNIDAVIMLSKFFSCTTDFLLGVEEY